MASKKGRLPLATPGILNQMFNKYKKIVHSNNPNSVRFILFGLKKNRQKILQLILLIGKEHNQQIFQRGTKALIQIGVLQLLLHQKSH